MNSISGVQAATLGSPAKITQDLKESPKLKDACEKFSALFINMLWQQMRNTVPEDGIIPKSSGEKIFQEMMDYELSERMSKTDNFPLSRVLYDQLRLGLTPDQLGESETK